MSPRKPNMLEAFQASAKADKAKLDNAREAASSGQIAREAGPMAEPSAPLGVGGPFAAESHEAPLPTSSLGNEILGTAPRQKARPSGRLPLILLLVIVAMFAMFMLGREFAGDNEVAAGPETPEGSSALELAGPASLERTSVPEEIGHRPEAQTPEPSSRTSADRAFLDSTNRISVRAIEFSSDSRGRARAFEVYAYLREQGLPAVAPIQQGNALVICVGAEPSQNKEIERIRAALKRLPGPPPQKEAGAFKGAYFVNIEDQIDEDLRH